MKFIFVIAAVVAYGVLQTLFGVAIAGLFGAVALGLVCLMFVGFGSSGESPAAREEFHRRKELLYQPRDRA